MKKVTVKRIAAAAAAIVLMATTLSGCGAQGAVESKALDAQIAYASEKVNDFTHYERRSKALFSEDIFSKANAAAMMLREDMTDEDYAKIAHYLDLDSITVADNTRTVTASYPEDETGKSLGELGGKSVFSAIIRNVSPRQITDPVPTEKAGAYTLMAGVKSADGSGVVIIEVTTDAYADVCGETLAEKCGNNTFILRDGTVLSSTMGGVNIADTPESLGITEDDWSADSFDLTVEGIEYRCKAAVIGGDTVICGEPI